jgi:hypothetical protein
LGGVHVFLPDICVPDVTGWGGDVTIVFRPTSKSYFLSVGYDDRQPKENADHAVSGKQALSKASRTGK